MEKYLTVDCGNSSAKMMVWSARSNVLGTMTMRYDVAPEAAVAQLWNSHPDITKALICSVTDCHHAIERAIMKYWPVQVLSSHTPTPLNINYAPTLGPDRLAAAVGAYFPGTSALVCDLGTAATFDYIDADGRFCGGNISPGLGLRLDALHGHTKRLPKVTPAGIDTAALLGTDTEGAIRRGCTLGLAAEIEYYHRNVDPSARVFLTGADAQLLEPLLTTLNPIHHPHLVGEGLYKILLYNEKV